jgi:hypothetical protein
MFIINLYDLYVMICMHDLYVCRAACYDLHACMCMCMCTYIHTCVNKYIMVTVTVTDDLF